MTENKKAKGILVLFIFILITVGVFSTVSLSRDDPEQVTLKVTPAPLIDVVLTKSKTSTNVNNFSNDLMNALRNQAVDTTKVKISSIQAENVNMASSFKWNEDVSSRIGSISKSSDGKNVTMEGNPDYPGKNAIWIIPDEDEEQEFTFSYDIDYGDSFNAAGMLLRVQQSGSTLTGYMLSFNNTSGDNWYSAAGSNYGGIWRFTYKIGDNNNNMTKTLLRGIDIDKSGSLTVKVTDSDITISGGGMSSSVTYSFSQEYGSGFGFFADHYDHNCSRIGSFELTNINLKTTQIRKFTEVLREPEWRDNSIRVLVNISDAQNEELNNTAELGELVTRLINENINFAAWGKSTNQSQFQNLINSNNGNGIFINNSSYSNSIQSTAVYIKSLIDKIDTNSQYILLDSQTELNSEPAEVFNNTADENYPYGKWRIVHDYLYYENNIGQFAQSRRYIDDMITKFDKTGKYTITYADNPVNPSEIYVHRRPVSLLKSSKNGTSLSLISSSYDLDLYSQGANGVAEEEWKYKRTTDSNWTVGKPTSISSNTDYVVQLRVKDYQGAWSYPVSIYATNRTDALPVASFGIINNEITKYEELEVLDTSYDPYGGTITSWQWEVYKGGSRIYTGSQPLTKYTDLGEYTMSLTVKNNRNLTSETYSRKFTIIEDSIAPEFVADPESCDWTQSVDVNLSFTDMGGSNFKNYQYAITDSQATPSSWSSAIAKQNDTVTINQEGIKYLHVIATDNAGNVSDDRVLGEYKIDRTGPIIQVTGDLQTTVIDSLSLNINVTDALSGLKKISINGQEIQNGTNTFIKNGEYTITAEDNVGNISTQTINIQNIYYECDAGLEHPIYSSTYDSCPICDAFEGLKVTVQSHIYNAQKQGVEYENPKNATIVEYYDGVKENPKKAGTYSYELKVIYEENEYKTGVKGTYIINPSTLTINGIVAKDKIYDGTTLIEISQGELSGIYAGDEVTFVLPKYGLAENKNVGTHNILVEGITLEGRDALNYTLKQPDLEDVQATITKREVYVEKLKGKNKAYDGSNVVEIVEGNLVNKVNGDDLTAVVPPTGTAESANVGRWKVDIEDIVLVGVDKDNYTILQPKEGEIKVSIMKYEGILEIGCESKKYDREPIEPYVISNNSTSEVKYKFYIAGTDEEIERPYDIGDYEVEASIDTDGNYTEDQTERISFSITKPDEPLIKIESNIIEVNGAEIESNVEEELNYNDTFKIRIDIKNIGKGSGYASKMVVTIPDGVELIKESETNKKYEWKMEEKLATTNVYSIEKSLDNEIFPDEEGRYLEMELKIVKQDKEKIHLPINIETEQQDKHGDIIKYADGNRTYSINNIDIEYKFFDVSVKNSISQFVLTNLDTQKEEKFDIHQRNNQIIKTELADKRAKNTIATIKYQIIITNEGNEKGIITKITDTLPKGLTIRQNSNWQLDSSGNISYNEPITLEPGEVKTLELLLDWDLREQMVGSKKTTVTVYSATDLDEIQINEGKLKLEESNNYSSSEMIISLPTGSELILYVIISFACLSIIGCGIVIVKKVLDK